MKKKKAATPQHSKSSVPTYAVQGARGQMVYKKKEENKGNNNTAGDDQEETKQDPMQRIVRTTGPKWEKKEDRLRREEEAEAKKVEREQNRTRRMLERIFRKADDGGMAEDELEEAVMQQFKSQLMRTARRNIGRRRGRGGARGPVSISEEADNRMTEESKASAADVMEAMKHGFLANDYDVDLEASGGRMYRKKQEEDSDVELDAEASKEVDAMAEKFHSFGSGNSFTLDDVRKFFQSADDAMLKKLCHDLKHNIFEDLFTVTKEVSTGDFLFVKKAAP